MKTEYENLVITSASSREGKNVWKSEAANFTYAKHKITVYNKDTKKRFSFDHWHDFNDIELSEEQLLEVFFDFIKDADDGGLSYSDFCETWGYDSNAREAYKSFTACVKCWQKCERIGISQENRDGVRI
jgi:hypothetical protein